MNDITGGLMDRVNTYGAGSDEDKHNALYKILAALGKGVKTAGQAVGDFNQQMTDDPGLRGQIAKLSVGLTAMDPRNNLAFGNTVVDLIKNQILSDHKAKFDKYLAGGAVGTPPTLSGRSASFIAGEDLSATEKQSMDLMQTMGQIEQARASTKNIGVQTELAEAKLPTATDMAWQEYQNAKTSGDLMATQLAGEKFKGTIAAEQYQLEKADLMSKTALTDAHRKTIESGENQLSPFIDSEGKPFVGMVNMKTGEIKNLGGSVLNLKNTEPLIKTADGLVDLASFVTSVIPKSFYDPELLAKIQTDIGAKHTTNDLIQAMTPVGRDAMNEALPYLATATEANIGIILDSVMKAWKMSLTTNVSQEDLTKMGQQGAGHKKQQSSSVLTPEARLWLIKQLAQFQTNVRQMKQLPEGTSNIPR